VRLSHRGESVLSGVLWLTAVAAELLGVLLVISGSCG
jgi:hypothetical protein